MGIGLFSSAQKLWLLYLTQNSAPKPRQEYLQAHIPSKGCSCHSLWNAHSSNNTWERLIELQRQQKRTICYCHPDFLVQIILTGLTSRSLMFHGATQTPQSLQTAFSPLAFLYIIARYKVQLISSQQTPAQDCSSIYFFYK